MSRTKPLEMRIFREQLGTLLSLELTYAKRDYMLDLVCYAGGSKLKTNGQPKCNRKDNAASHVISLQRTVGVLPVVVTTDTDGEIDAINAGNDCNSAMIRGKISTSEQYPLDCRMKICEWSHQVTDHFNLSRDIATITLDYLDRVFSNPHGTESLRDTDRFQLLAMASLSVAVKVHGNLDVNCQGMEYAIFDTILHLSHHRFEPKELATMELELLQRLQWLLNPPTPQTFVSYFTLMFYDEDSIELIREIAVYIVELSVYDYFFVVCKPSLIALAALSIASRLVGRTDLWISKVLDDLLKNHGYDDAVKMDACRERLEKVYAVSGTKLEDFTEIDVQADLEQMDCMDCISLENSPTSIIS